MPSLWRAEGSAIGVLADSRQDAERKFSVMAVSKKLRDYIDDTIYGTGFRIDEFDVGDKNTCSMANNYLRQDYFKVMLVFVGDDAWKVGIDIPDVDNMYESKVSLSRKTYNEQELVTKLEELGKTLKAAEAEHVKIIKDFNKKLKSLI